MADSTDSRADDRLPPPPSPDDPGLFGAAPAPASPPVPKPARDPGYRVLARKYRPQTFADLMGQEAMVRTLENAFAQGRIAQAFMLTGVRGVGKTTTARIVAKGLNCLTAAGPTVTPCGTCSACVAIADSRHVDVMEMDAASRTGVDDIREIIDGVRYAPAEARYKVYIIDEIHMLSKNAFNALLKTLEEPPPHAKFIFATTEIRKVPVTVLSRCQRFDLRRIPAETITALLTKVCAAEGVAAEADAFALLARAGEGSARDTLSLLDQAIAHGGGAVTGTVVREMLGLADRTRVFDIFEMTLRGDAAGAIGILRDLYDAGGDPLVAIQDMLELTHWVTRLVIVPDARRDTAHPEAEMARATGFADALSIPVLTRAWQMLSKAAGEVARASHPIMAAEMALVRLAYAADLPPPGDLVRQLRDNPPVAGAGGGAASAPPSGGGAGGGTGGATGGGGGRGPTGLRMVQGGGAPASVQNPAQGHPVAAVATPRAQAGATPLPTFEAVIALAAEKRDILLKTRLENDVHLVAYTDGRISLRLTDDAPQSLPGEIKSKLEAWTGRTWGVTISREAGDRTIAAVRRESEERRRAEAARHPMVRAALEMFPGATIAEVRSAAAAVEAEAEAAAEGVGATLAEVPVPIDPEEEED